MTRWPVLLHLRVAHHQRVRSSSPKSSARSRPSNTRGAFWRAIGKKLGIPAMTALEAYRTFAVCTETVLPEKAVSVSKRNKKSAAP